MLQKSRLVVGGKRRPQGYAAAASRAADNMGTSTIVSKRSKVAPHPAFANDWCVVRVVRSHHLTGLSSEQRGRVAHKEPCALICLQHHPLLLFSLCNNGRDSLRLEQAKSLTPTTSP
ncbi:MAG: hypothetical protein ACR2H5_01220 [Ktedonobacteraceae bacterium]